MNLIEHGKARFDYEILETIEAGIELSGTEVKSLRRKQGKLEGSHVIVRGGEVYIVGMHIPPYQPGNTPESYDPGRTRKLLLSKVQIGVLAGHEQQKGLTLIPLSVYNKRKNLKVSVGVARGKKKFDKRAALKKKDADREVQRALKNA